MVSSTGILPPGMVGGGAFDIHGNCKGMIEGVVQKPILKPMMESFTKKWECLLTNADNGI